MPTTYPVDYTGTALPNKILNEPHSISAANFRNFKVIIPEFAPFHVNGLVITHPATNYTLIEDQDYYLTHLYVEASKSIGHDIHGSISITSNLTGVFEVSYQTVGGEWTLPANTLANILANLAINPRIAYWTQVALYPAVFPTINHSTDVEDLTGMTEVVQAIDGLGTILEDQQNLGGIADPYATIAEAKAGMAANRVMNPATTFAAIQESIDDFRTELAGSGEDTGMTAFNKDFFGDASFINDAYKVVYENAQFTALKGLAYVDGLRNEALVDIPLTVNSFPKDVWLESFFSADTSDVEHTLTTTDAALVTNLLPYSSNLGASVWSGRQNNVSNPGIITPNTAYGIKGKRSLGRLTMSDAGSVARLRFYTNLMTVGATYNVSFYARSVSGNTALTIKLGLGGHSRSVTLTNTLQRFVVDLVYTDHDQLSFRLADAGVLELGDVQAEVGSSLLMIDNPSNLNAGSWTTTGVTVTANSAAAPWITSPMVSKLAETTANSEHSVQGAFTCVPGHHYQVSFIVKQAERDVIEIASTGAGAGVGTSRITISTNTVNVNAAVHKSLTVTTLAEDVSVADFKLVSFVYYAESAASTTLAIKLYNGASSYTGTSGSGVLISSLVIADTLTNKTAINLLPASNALDTPYWNKTGSLIDRRLFVNAASSETAFKLVESIVTGEHSLMSSKAMLADKDLVFSVYVKAAERTRVRIELSGGTGGASYTIDLSNVAGAVAATLGTGWSLVAGNVSSAGNGWSRISIKGHTDLSAAHYPVYAKVYVLDETGEFSYTGDGTSGIYIDRPQLENTTVATAYVAASVITANNLIPTYLGSVSNYSALSTKKSWYDHNGNYHRYIKLATVLSSSNIKDYRNVVFVNTTLADRSAKTYRPITPDKELIADSYYWLSNNEVVKLPPTQFLSPGATFYFEKPLGSVCSIGLEDTGNDAIFALNYDTGQIVSDIEFTYNSSNELRAIFNGSDYEIRF